ncbi:MAG: hypothetical protein HKN20_14725 [Gemmatimonadetes bacterium]|nr:hypothetical protein [Gemmatimonadota bacterium]
MFFLPPFFRPTRRRGPTTILLAAVTIAALSTTGCGDSNVAEPDAPRTIKVLFAQFEMPDGSPVRFQIDHPETTSVPVIEYVPAPSPPSLFDDPVLGLDSLRVESDSLFFRATSSSGAELFRVRAKRSAFILVGKTIFPDSSEPAVLSGLTCLVEPGSGTQEPFPGEVSQLAFPIRFSPPVYPDTLVQGGIDGTVRTLVQVGSCGSVLDLEIVRSEHPDLDSLTAQTIRGWLFYPALVGSFSYVALEQFLSIRYEIIEGVPVVTIQNGA